MMEQNLDPKNLHEILECVGEGIIYQRADGLIKFYNPAAHRILGIGGHGSERLSSSHPQLNMVYEDGSPCPGEEHPSMITLHTGRALSGQIRGVVKPGQPVIWLSINTRPILHPGQDLPEAVVISINDITACKKTEEASRQSQERLKLAFDTSPDSIGINRLSDGLYVDINQGFTALTGFTRADVAGRTPLDLNIWDDPADYQRLLKGLGEKGHFENREIQFRGKDGGPWTGLMSARIIMLDGQPHILSITRDISERIRSGEENELLKAQLLQAQKMEAVGTLAGGIAHDFNNLLCVILGYADRAQNHCLCGKEGGYDIDQIANAAGRASRLVRQLLTFSRRGQARMKPADLNGELRQFVEMLERTIPKMVAIEFKPGQDLALINCDPNHIELMLFNLANNAVDAMPDGGRLTFSTRNVKLNQTYCREHPEAHPGSHVLLEVSDSGQGMTAETLQHIFEPFFTTKGIGKGTGLGLSTVYGIMADHGGHLTCHSEPDTGTTMKAYWPALKGALASNGAQPEALPDGRVRGNECILLADDEDSLRKMAAEALEEMGYEVARAENGEQALDIYRGMEHRPELVILDLDMPGMGGRRCLKEILAINPRAKVLIASGYAINGAQDQGLSENAAGFLPKPFRVAELLSTVRNVLDGK